MTVRRMATDRSPPRSIHSFAQRSAAEPVLELLSEGDALVKNVLAPEDEPQLKAHEVLTPREGRRS